MLAPILTTVPGLGLVALCIVSLTVAAFAIRACLDDEEWEP